jgi:hypothetical protein
MEDDDWGRKYDDTSSRSSELREGEKAGGILAMLTIDVAMMVVAHMQARPAPDVPSTDGGVPATCSTIDMIRSGQRPAMHMPVYLEHK